MRIVTQYEERRRWVSQGTGEALRMQSVQSAHVIMTFDHGEGPKRDGREYLEIVFLYGIGLDGWTLEKCRISEVWLKKNGHRRVQPLRLDIPVSHLVGERAHLRELAESVKPRVYPWRSR